MLIQELTHVRLTEPGRIASAAAGRSSPGLHRVAAGRPLFLVAADHPARGALKVGDDPLAMADREELLDRLRRALANPRVDGVLATPDIVEDLLLLGELDDRLVVGSMNRGGLAGAVWELDDRFTAFDAHAIDALGLDAGKMLLRINLEERDTNPTLQACARAVGELAARGRVALIEPLPVRRNADGLWQVSKDTTDLVKAVTIASGLGPTSAFTWLKLPVSDEVEQVLAASTLPVLLLGGDPGPDPERVFDGWRRALATGRVAGLVPGRALLYPRDGDVESAVAQAAAILDDTATVAAGGDGRGSTRA